VPGLAWAIASLGCLTTRTPPVQQDLDALKAQVAAIQSREAELTKQLAAAQASAPGGSPAGTEAADLDARIRSLESQVAALQQRLADTTDQINSLSVDLTATRELALRVQPPRSAPSQPPEGDGEGTGSPPTETQPAESDDGKTAGATLEDTFSTAYADFTKGNYSLAIAGFQEFLKRFPGSELADNAQFWIGESSFSQGDFETAAAQYEQVIQKYPKGDRVPAALLKKGICLTELNRTPEGVIVLQKLIQTFPSSEEAALARDRLAALGVKP
jgi:tol-pal system protein YbgF